MLLQSINIRDKIFTPTCIKAKSFFGKSHFRFVPFIWRNKVRWFPTKWVAGKSSDAKEKSLFKEQNIICRKYFYEQKVFIENYYFLYRSVQDY